MKLIIGGTRGTNPVCQPDFMKFGGETTSFLVEGEAGERILIDAGTGVRTLGQRLEQRHPAAELMLLLTHYHLDHVMGLPSLSLIYKARWNIDITSPMREGFRVDEVMPRLFDRPLWPLQVEELGSRIHFKTMGDEASRVPLRYGNLEIRWCPMHHPGGSTAYRIDEPASGASAVIATDVEWAESSAAEQANLIDLAHDTDLLVMDGQFTSEDYAAHKGWGHSTWLDGCDVARAGAVKSLLITHHAPEADDAILTRREQVIQAQFPSAGLARAGAVIALGSKR